MHEIEPNEGPITLRMGKDNGKVGVGQRKPMGFNKTAPLKHRSDKNLRGREEKVLRVLKVLIVQEIHHATGQSIESLSELELDHIHLRNGHGFEPFGNMLSPRNMQLLNREQHEAKTNPIEGSGITDRHDFRTTNEQEVMINLERRLIEAVGKVFTLEEFGEAVESMINPIGEGETE